MKKIFISLMVVFFSFQNGEKKNVRINDTDETTIESNDSIKKIIKQQVMHGYGIKEKGLDIENNYNYKKEDYEVIKSVSNNILKKHNYKIINEKKFKNKVSIIFGFKNVNKNVNFLIEYPCQLKKVAYQLDINYITSNNNPIFIDFKNNILFEALFIPELINYETLYPDLFIKEDKIKREKIIDKEVVQVIRWKDVPNLAENRKKNIQKLVARNKYLFNDDKSYFVWLTENDEYFMESLVKVFGYTKDRELLKWVVGKTVYKENDPQEYGRILWTKSCDGKLTIHNNTIKLFKADSTNKETIKKDIKNYITYLSGNKITELNHLTHEEKDKIILAIKPIIE
ncbi:hypothetical protein MQX03_18545 [Chryseobacterium aahli]|uniref:hypothetical protein n=1 Tax=Chryseobacterium aahli TaxID=1278643 RepID=UPI001F619BD6|nr:hypothetical protein [Chryseobacterium aahli]MCI3939177.1 hypothetical protein [Chryseobacterium aahli]